MSTSLCRVVVSNQVRSRKGWTSLNSSGVQSRSSPLVYRSVMNTCRIYGSSAGNFRRSTCFVKHVQSNSNPPSRISHVTSLICTCHFLLGLENFIFIFIRYKVFFQLFHFFHMYPVFAKTFPSLPSIGRCPIQFARVVSIPDCIKIIQSS